MLLNLSLHFLQHFVCHFFKSSLSRGVPAVLSPPTVEIADPSPVLSGSSFSLTCSITVPIVATGPPTVQWVGPLSSMPGIVSSGGSGSYTSTATLTAYSLAYEGEYTCTAMYPVGGQDSPPSSDSVTITINRECSMHTHRHTHHAHTSCTHIMHTHRHTHHAHTCTHIMHTHAHTQ